MLNGRQSFRLRKQIDLYWKIDEKNFAQKGQLHNISLSGLRFEIGKASKPAKDTIFYLSCPDIPDLPKKAQLMWLKSIDKTGGYLCGVVFIKEKGLDYAPAWRKWMEDNIGQLADVADNKILGKYLDFSE